MCDSVYVLVTNFPFIIRNDFRLLHTHSVFPADTQFTTRITEALPSYWHLGKAVILVIRNTWYVTSPFDRIADTSHPVLSKVSKAILTFSREANLYIMKKTATKGPTVTTHVVGWVLPHNIWTVCYTFLQHVKVDHSI